MDVVGWCFKRLSALQHNTVVSQDRQGPPLARDYFGDFLLLRSSRGWMQKWIRASPHIIEGRHARTHGRADTNQLYDSFLAGLYCVSYEKHHNRKVGSAFNKLQFKFFSKATNFTILLVWGKCPTNWRQRES